MTFLGQRPCREMWRLDENANFDFVSTDCSHWPLGGVSFTSSHLISQCSRNGGHAFASESSCAQAPDTCT